MQKEKKDKHFIKKPIYPGGKKALQLFITQNLKYPPDALKEKIEGTVVLKYTVNHQGKVIDTKVISSLGHGCDEEAERVVSLLQFEVPSNRGVKVLHHLNIQIHFRLPKQKARPIQKKEAKPSYNYQYTPSSSEDAKEKPTSSPYTYTITIK
ncbi:MAG: energy transducer TonB [Saprospiraceae bacterium]|nr:energy transducer TonB [Saprospiraceae bacterium]